MGATAAAAMANNRWPHTHAMRVGLALEFRAELGGRAAVHASRETPLFQHVTELCQEASLAGASSNGPEHDFAYQLRLGDQHRSEQRILASRHTVHETERAERRRKWSREAQLQHEFDGRMSKDKSSSKQMALAGMLKQAQLNATSMIPKWAHATVPDSQVLDAQDRLTKVNLVHSLAPKASEEAVLRHLEASNGHVFATTEKVQPSRFRRYQIEDLPPALLDSSGNLRKMY